MTLWRLTCRCARPVARAIVALTAGLALLGAGVASAHAAEVVVDDLGDSGPGTLRAAIEAAEADAAADRIVIEAAGTIALQAPLEPIDTALEIAGPGADALELTRAPGAPPFRVLEVGVAGELELSGVTVSGGYLAGGFDERGAGILSAGSLVVRDAVVRDNELAVPPSFRAQGAGIYASGPLYLERVEVRGNVISAQGGFGEGAGVFARPQLEIAESVFDGNRLDVSDPLNAKGAAVFLSDGEGAIRRSVVTANTGPALSDLAFVGALHNGAGELLVENTTLAGNVGGVVAHSTGVTTVSSSTILGGPGEGPGLGALNIDVPTEVRVRNTILADPGPGSANCEVEMADQATFVSLGNNISSDGSCPFLGRRSDRQGVDPGLRPLREGAAAPRACGAAADSGASHGLEVDQRGEPRPRNHPRRPALGDGADVGAVERQGPPCRAFEARVGARGGALVVRLRLPGPGRVAVRGARVRPVRRAVRAAGERRLRVRVRQPAGAARRIEVRVSFRPRGGAPSTKRFAIRLPGG